MWAFFPFVIHDYAQFPEDHTLIICNSRIQARKAAGARDAFNERIASYALAVELVRKRFPNYAPLIEHLRDISPERLGVRVADIYRILLDVPLTQTPEEWRAELGAETFERLTAIVGPSDQYYPRDRLLFGVAECARSKKFFEWFKGGQMEKAGWLMRLSHDGDRVVGSDGKPFETTLEDAGLRSRIEALRSEDPEQGAGGAALCPAGRLCMQHPRDRPHGGHCPGYAGGVGSATVGRGVGRVHDGVGPARRPARRSCAG